MLVFKETHYVHGLTLKLCWYGGILRFNDETNFLERSVMIGKKYHYIGPMYEVHNKKFAVGILVIDNNFKLHWQRYLFRDGKFRETMSVEVPWHAFLADTLMSAVFKHEISDYDTHIRQVCAKSVVFRSACVRRSQLP